MLCQPLCVLVGTILQCSMKKCATFNFGSTHKESIGCSTNLHCLVKYISDRRCLVTKPAPPECSQDSDMKPTSQNNLETDGLPNGFNRAKEEEEAYKSSDNRLGSASTQESKPKPDAFRNKPQLQDKAGFSPGNAQKQGDKSMDGSSPNTATAVTKATENPEENSVSSKRKQSPDFLSTLFSAGLEMTNSVIGGGARSTKTTK